MFVIYFHLCLLVSSAIGDLRCPFWSNADITTENDLPPIKCPKPPARCFQSKYRSIDGSCTNMKHRGWGMPNRRYIRLMEPNYGDGFASPTLAISGRALPSARTTSNKICLEAPLADHNYTLLNMQWGQTVAHDMSLLAGSTASIRKLTQCCTPDGKMMNATDQSPFCYPIAVPKDDAYLGPQGVECLNFVRTPTDVDMDYETAGDRGYAEQLSLVTPSIDLSHVYGQNRRECRRLRSFEGGALLTALRNGQEWLPPSWDNYDECNIDAADEICYRGGDVRINQNTGLVVLSIVFVREHNRLARALSAINPHWSDERLFEEARRINVAEYQAITYYEWLPILLGQANLTRYGLTYENTDGCYVNDFDENVNPAVLNEHAHACFRYAHSQISGSLHLMNSRGAYNTSIRLSDYYMKPAIVEDDNNFDQLLYGMAFQAQLATDNNYDPEIRDYWLRLGRRVGDDLRAVDIQRSRDHGLRSYNDYRVWSGKARATRWEDYLDTVPPKAVDNWKEIYGSHEDVDLTVGASSEHHEPGTLGGPLLNAILMEQFYRTRVADRFFFENGADKVARFTLEQLRQLRKSSAALMLCNNGQHMTRIQSRCFELVSDENPLVKCSSLPKINLSAWKENRIESVTRNVEI